jgi:hypothetical protein
MRKGMSQTIPPLPPLISGISVSKSNFYCKRKILTMVNSLVTENKNEILTVLPHLALFALHIGLDS